MSKSLTKQYALVDIMKFVFAMLVVLLHTINSNNVDAYTVKGVLYLFVTYILCRIAVPFFFTVSGYFCFKNM